MNHLFPLIGNKTQVMVADVGCGPYALRSCVFATGAKVTFYPMDKKQFPGVEIQDMENLTCPDDSFDIVQCINALDHTKDARKAVMELIRVAKEWVYIDCSLDQLTTSGGWHYWDAKEDGTLENNQDKFSLKQLGFKIHYYDSGGQRRYNRITAIFHKEQQ